MLFLITKLIHEKMRKITLVAFTLLVFSSISFSQAFSGGITLGLGGNQIDGDRVGGFNKFGFLGGFYVETNKDEKSALRIETHYIGKGSVDNIKNQAGVVIEQPFKVTLHYLEMPVLYRYRFHEKFSASAGVAPAYLIKGTTYVYRREEYTDLKNYDVGLAAQMDFYLLKKLPFWGDDKKKDSQGKQFHQLL